jgi:SUMO ligase MMS21 Smc5/6 complex component
MDNQQIFNLVIVFAGFLAVWVFNNITNRISKIEEKLEDMPHTYVAKDDYRADIAEIKTMLQDIYKELRNKADK